VNDVIGLTEERGAIQWGGTVWFRRRGDEHFYFIPFLICGQFLPLELRFGDPSNLFSLSVSSLETVLVDSFVFVSCVASRRALPVNHVRFFPHLVSWNIFLPQQVCDSTLPYLDFQ
jgi:hypothetical protein